MTRRRTERGTTLVEVMVVVVLLTSVMASMFAVFSSMTKAEHRNELMVENRHVLSQGLGEVQRDLRAASSIEPASSSALAADEVTVRVPDGAGGTRVVRFEFDADHLTLRRTDLDNAGRTTSQRRLLDQLGDDAKVATFRYFAADGRELVAGVEPTKVIARCTVRIETTVTRQVPGTTSRLAVSVDSAPRNIRPEDVTC